jgi:serine phosphatase RsbU (regulator of sigma subunit)
VSTLRRLVQDDPEVDAALDHVVEAAAAWRTRAAEPEINARRGGVVDAKTLVASGLGRSLFGELRAQVSALQDLIEHRRNASQTRVIDANHTLTTWLWVTVAIALLVAVGVMFALAQWVVGPLQRLSAALRRVGAGHLDAVVTASGPPEFVQVAADAEGMRRRIVEELERSEASRQALEQRGPVVVGLSQELAPQVTGPVPGLRYATALRPAEGILAGDWVDVLPLERDRIALLLLDVSGHGAAAGLEALRLKYVLTTALRFGHQPHEALARAAEGFSEDERFATAVIVIVDVVTGDLRWANAGHLAPRLVPLNSHRLDPEDTTPLDPTGPLLSSLPSLSAGGWTTRSTRLEVGQMVLAFSDGLTEARNALNQEFGVAGLCSALSQTTVRDVDTAVSVCLAAVRAYASDPHRDDVTLIAATRDPSTVSAREPDGSPESRVPRQPSY